MSNTDQQRQAMQALGWTLRDIMDFEEKSGVDFNVLAKRGGGKPDDIMQNGLKVAAAFLWIQRRKEQPGLVWETFLDETPLEDLATIAPPQGGPLGKLSKPTRARTRPATA